MAKVNLKTKHQVELIILVALIAIFCLIIMFLRYPR
jgi:hypothetical protein